MKNTLLLLCLLTSLVNYSQAYQIDTNFNIGDGLNETAIVEDIAIQSDGKIIIVGSNFTTLNGISVSSNILRLNISGELDIEFTNIVSNPKSIAIQADGKILIAGNSSTNNTRIVRFNNDGSIDNSFSVGNNSNDGFNATINKIDIESNGRILVFGDFTTYSGNTIKPLVRLNSDGTLYFPLSSVGFGVRGYELLDSGKILVSEFGPNILKRINQDGTQDNSFNEIASKGFYLFEELNDNSIICATKNNDSYTEIYKINENGGINESSFNTYTITDPGSGLSSINKLSDGKLLLTVSFGGIPQSKLILLNSNGIINTDNNFGVGFELQYALACEIQDDGKLLFGGNFNSYNGVTKYSLIRLVNSTLSNEEFENRTFSIFPNPVLSFVNIPLIFNAHELSYEIFDINGKKVQNGVAIENRVIVKNLTSGIYILSLKTDNKQFTSKFIKI